MNIPNCAKCVANYCQNSFIDEINENNLPDYCPMKSCKKLIHSVISKYNSKKVKELYVPATITEKEAYEYVRGIRMGVRPRIKELIEFCKLIRKKRIGIAFCSGLKDEARRITDILEKTGFIVSSIMCKCGGIDKTKLQVPKQYKIGDSSKFEAGCNPIIQAEILNKVKTELNVIVGLCIGHDMLFTMNSNVPVTTLIVKDRMLGHNPAIALYSSYLKRIVDFQKTK
jgi:uncharacterized metal-binding protein